VGAATSYADYVSGNETGTLTFQYTFTGADSDADGISVASLDLNGGLLTFTVNGVVTNCDVTTVILTTLPGVIVDALAPSISSRTIPGNGTYDSGDVLQFTTTFSEIVTVVGTPRIQVAAQTGTLNFDYVSGTGTTTLTFQYTATANDFDFDGLPASITTIALNAGTIKDASGNNASLTFTAADLSAVFLAYPNTVLWSTSSFSNRSAIAGLTVSGGGAITTQACGTSTCRTFDGDDSFNVVGTITAAEEVFIVFTTPSTLANQDLFDTDISLVNDGTAFDINSTNATLNLDGAAFTGVNHNTNMSVASTHILHTTYTATQNYATGALITSGFLGAIGEVIVVTSPLTAPQRSAILTYLNSKY
jgi:hypothetical protein